ncbi:HAMP domain-containing histidine kinase [Dermabacter sp. p3-SID358]|uniref:sensor histidine kinase n=1 Tax=Dermabacter sp. p3-SID358 TaxID=2916114 RepID=UPI0021A63B02|nr:HAMP domain-containing sensor histidine kinase [Dermabacter sp. p3-SID358]MCT1866963.1 HAMP domain-containing histidine kinase [Dermabacter sp. p3-SID358]
MKKHPFTYAVVVVALPLVVGLIASLVWSLFGDTRHIYFSMALAWLPVTVGVLLTLAALPALGSWWYTRHAVRRAQRETAAEQTASRRRLIARLDHEIKNPIQGIRAALADEPSERQRQSIDAQSRRLTSLLSDLRKIGEVEHTQLEVTEVDPSRLVHDAIETAREVPGASERSMSVSLPTAPRPLPPIKGDEDLLFLCLVNVLTNAVKYSRPGDAIEVRGRQLENGILLEVADTGLGIAPDDIPLVWEELGRASEVRGIEGSGLGLPMVKAIVERHGGTAALTSWHGEGTSVSLTLPFAGPAH